MHFDFLSNFGAFAINCQVMSDKLTVGLLVLDGDLPVPEEIELFNNSGSSFLLKLPEELPEELFDLELERL